MTDEERAKLRETLYAADDFARTVRNLFHGSAQYTPADLEGAWQRLLALRWQSMDSAPRDGTRILLLWGGRTVAGVFDIRWLEMPAVELCRGWFTTEDGVYPDGEPTAWMPLPPVKEC